MKYLVKLVFHVSAPNGNRESGKPSEFEEQYRIVNAVDAGDAFMKARRLGESEQGAVGSARHESIRWQFIDAVDVIKLDSRDDGAQLFSATVHEDPRTYIPYLRLRAGAVEHAVATVEA
jgi:hypothetical protein